jgi:hypothetical protein
MGFLSFLKKVFAGEGADEKELDAARQRHGIAMTQEDKKIANKPMSEMDKFASEYDVWEEIDRYRTTFFVGGWLAKKFHPVGEEKVKRELEKLEKQRQEEARKKAEKESRANRK